MTKIVLSLNTNENLNTFIFDGEESLKITDEIEATIDPDTGASEYLTPASRHLTVLAYPQNQADATDLSFEYKLDVRNNCGSFGNQIDVTSTK